MVCPKCESVMEPVTFNSITVQRCTNCLGIWFPEAEHKELKAMKGSEAIDIGSPKIGKAYDAIRTIACPTCAEIMESVTDTFQPHIRYEACVHGHGVFFDAGEYKDFKEETLGDFFKSLSMRHKQRKG